MGQSGVSVDQAVNRPWSRNMKPLPLFGALLLSASPVAAENLVYLKCRNQMTLTSTEIKTGKLINEKETREELLYLKIDPVGNRFMTFNPSSEQQNNQWDEAAISGGRLSAKIAEDNDALNVEGELDVEFQPAGKLRSQVSAIAFGMISSEIEITGDCMAVDESVFDAAQDQSDDN